MYRYGEAEHKGGRKAGGVGEKRDRRQAAAAPYGGTSNKAARSGRLDAGASVERRSLAETIAVRSAAGQ